MRRVFALHAVGDFIDQCPRLPVFTHRRLLLGMRMNRTHRLKPVSTVQSDRPVVRRAPRILSFFAPLRMTEALRPYNAIVLRIYFCSKGQGPHPRSPFGSAVLSHASKLISFRAVLHLRGKALLFRSDDSDELTGSFGALGID